MVVPRRFQRKIVDNGIGENTFGQNADAFHYVVGGVAEGPMRFIHQHRKLPTHIGFAAEVIHATPKPWRLAELLRLLP